MRIRYADLFCGIGGFRFAAEDVFKSFGLEGECVFSCDNDRFAQKSYAANFGETPAGDITKVESSDIPDIDLLFAGFPCQPFSIIGQGKGFEDSRGTLFYEIARILEEKKPAGFVLENVKQLASHDNGRTIKTIMRVLDELGYRTYYNILNALHYGLPQKRERIIFVGLNKNFRFEWPQRSEECLPLNAILEENPDKKFFASSDIVRKRKERHKSEFYPAIWHENKSGNISSYPYSCALRAGASYNYLLVNGERRLTPRETLRLQGFPDSFKIVVSDAQIRRQAGNAVPVNIVSAVLKSYLPHLIDTLKENKDAQSGA